MSTGTGVNFANHCILHNVEHLAGIQYMFVEYKKYNPVLRLVSKALYNLPSKEHSTPCYFCSSL